MKKKCIFKSKGGIPINCYYHIFAERADGERLIPEYEGESPQQITQEIMMNILFLDTTTIREVE